MRAKDLTGQRYGSLVVMRRVEKTGKDQHAKWLCRCDCGSEIVVASSKLGRQTTSCAACVYSTRSEMYTEDLTGQRFGRLTVIERTDKHVGTWIVWRCMCECGKMIDAASGNLKAGNVKSCGCLYQENFPDHTSLPIIRSKTIYKSNTSGVRGVSFDKKRGKWNAYIRFKGVEYRLGSYYNIEEARKARDHAEETMFDAYVQELEEREKKK